MCTIDNISGDFAGWRIFPEIEGRMKRPEYAAGVTSIYRKYLDLYEKNPKNYEVTAEDKQMLLDLYQREWV